MFGGPDYSYNKHNILQNAISYSMNSILSSGGIRGSKISLINFQPRSFNMGINRKIFLTIGGFANLRIGEDIDFTLKFWEKGFKSQLFNNAYVFHKRKNTIFKFMHQMYKFGVSRIIINNKHKNYNNIIFYIPSLFLITFVIYITILLIYFFLPNNIYIYVEFLIKYISIFYIIYSTSIFFHAAYIYKNIYVGFFSVIITMIQINTYGIGFLHAFIKINILKQKTEKAFPSHFYL